MGFAKYLEDNMEMWEERNRERTWRPKRESPPMISKNAADRNRNTNGSIGMRGTHNCNKTGRSMCNMHNRPASA